MDSFLTLFCIFAFKAMVNPFPNTTFSNLTPGCTGTVIGMTAAAMLIF